MFEIAAVIGLGLLAFLFAYIAFQVEKDKLPLQLLFFALSLFFAACLVYSLSDFSLQSQTPQLLGTTEASLYWNCTALRGECSGNPEPESCSPYTEEQCTDIPGCTWNGTNCSGTPSEDCAWLGAYDPTGDKCRETNGCTWGSTEVNASCDRVIVAYAYTNSTDYSHQNSWYSTLYGVVLLLIVFVVMYLVLTIVISVFNMFWKKPGDNDDGDL